MEQMMGRVSRQPSEERPLYKAVPENERRAITLWAVEVDEGWRSSIVCGGMYEWAAEWLVEQLQGKPFAPGRRP